METAEFDSFSFDDTCREELAWTLLQRQAFPARAVQFFGTV
jgi:hypothetical protein